MQEIYVKNVIIGKQYESCKNYEKFKDIVEDKKNKCYYCRSGTKSRYRKKIYILKYYGQAGENKIKTNAINNNSLVCKLIYKNFSMLFTGDIEEVAEKAIVSKYLKNHDNINQTSNVSLNSKSDIKTKSILNSTVLKVAHHGSKTSSTKDFLNAVNPQYAIIGVGKNNNFGHPADITIQNLETKNIRIYRTDEMGEITILTNGNTIKFVKTFY